MPTDAGVSQPERGSVPAPVSARSLALWLAAALSGGAALAYEICWSRALVIPLGNSADATALVLAVFMLGMALGARIGGALAERWNRPLRGYAGLEAALGVYAVLAPSLFELLSRIPGDLVGLTGSGVLLRRVLAGVLVLIPCLPMGASVPLLVRALTREHALVGLEIGILYGANTAGAALGAVLTGFFGIARIGVVSWCAAAALASFAAANLALAADKAPRSGRTSLEVQATDAVPTRRRRLALIAAAVSGFAMLAGELLWARILTFVFGHDVYAFASLLALVLAGLAGGGLLHRLLARRDQLRLLAFLLCSFAWTLIVSFGAAAGLVVARGRDVLALEASGYFTNSVWLELWRELAYTPLLVLAPSLLAGVTFPAACAAYAGSSQAAGRSVGDVLLANGLGSALGASAGAFGLVSLAGIQGAFLLIGVLCAATAAGLWFFVEQRRRVRWALVLAPSLGLGALALALPSDLPRSMLLRAVGERHQTLLFYEEGRTATVSVIQNQINGEKQLVINAVNEVTTRLVHDQSFKLLGHLGPLLHGDPRRAVMICLGAGLSAGAALTHPLERLDVVDLSPTVIRGAAYFERENNGVLGHPGFRLHIADGRQFLLNSSGGYDLAIIDSTHPKAVDSWILYTKEFYGLVRARLAARGIVVQWLPLHGLSEREFKIIVNTFLGVFPDASLWANVGLETYGQVGYAKLVGALGTAPELRYADLARRLALPAIQADLAPFGMHEPVEVLDAYVAGAHELRSWTEGLPEQTDDHPLVSYTTDYSSGRRMEPSLLLAVRSHVSTRLADRATLGSGVAGALDSAWEAQGLVISGDLQRARELRPEGLKLRLFAEQARTTRGYYLALAERYRDDPDRQFEAGSQLATLGAPGDARTVLERAAARWPSDVRLELTLALVERALGDAPAALARLVDLSSRAPRSALLEVNLGAALLASGEPALAVPRLERASSLDPALVSAQLSLAQAHLDRGEDDLAGAVLGELLRDNPWVAEAEDMLGLAAARRSDYDLAIAHHRRAIAIQPYRAASHYNLGVALAAAGALAAAAKRHEAAAAGALAAAAEAYEAALRIAPAHSRAANNLGLLHALAGRHERATDLYLRALESDPSYAEAAYNLGMTLLARGLRSEAADAFCLSLRLRATLQVARARLAELGRREQDCSATATGRDIEHGGG